MRTVSCITFFLILLLLPLIVHSLQEVLILDLVIYKEGKAKLIDFYLDFGSESLQLSEKVSDYKIELISGDNIILYAKYFQPTFEAYLDVLPGESPPAELIRFNTSRITLKIPFDDDMRFIRLYYKDEVILQKMIDLCNNNNMCETSLKENILSCPDDCKSGSSDNYCDGVLDSVCDQDCINQGRKEKDIDCLCGNNICEEFENPATCRKDCKLTFWKWIVNLIKSLFG